MTVKTLLECHIRNQCEEWKRIDLLCYLKYINFKMQLQVKLKTM